MFILAVVMGIIVALAFVASGVPKITENEAAMGAADHLRVARPIYRVIGVLEVLGGVGLLAGLFWAWVGLAAGFGLLLLMVGAVGSHARVNDPMKLMQPAMTMAVTVLIYLVARSLSI